MWFSFLGWRFGVLVALHLWGTVRVSFLGLLGYTVTRAHIKHVRYSPICSILVELRSMFRFIVG